ncbi:MAG TPA: MFS transporter [Gaiellaceae bacterium]|nr:MFS transporter [Gaiellaceae bacterium]
MAAALAGAGWASNQFTPMLLVYGRVLGLGTGTLEAMFGFYALGLVPGLLLAGPLSDARGRRAVVVPAAGLSLVATLAQLAGGHMVALLFAGRLLTGLSTGAVFGAGTAWLRESSRPDDATDTRAARRAAVAMTTGFALGPLASGLLAQWAPARTVLPFLPHVVLTAGVLLALRSVPETVAAGRRRVRLSAPGLRSPRFRRVVAPMAPWVFAAPAIAFALLPSVVGADRARDGIALTAGITTLCALAGVLIQPVARRLDAGARGNRAATVGLVVLAAGLALGAVAAADRATWMLAPTSLVLGCAYGLCLVAGLVEVQRLADRRVLAAATATYYTLTYLGFAAPFLLTLAAPLAGYPALLAALAGLALVTGGLVTRRSRRFEPYGRPA